MTFAHGLVLPGNNCSIVNAVCSEAPMDEFVAPLRATAFENESERRYGIGALGISDLSASAKPRLGYTWTSDYERPPSS